MIYFVLAYATLLIFLLGHWQRIAFQHCIAVLLTHMEKRLMAQLDAQTTSTDEQLAQLRQGEADLKTAISAAGDRVVAKLDILQNKLNTQPLSAPAALDLSQDIQEMKNDMILLGNIAPADAPSAPVAPTTPIVAVGDTIGVPTDPADPNSPTLDHTITDIGTDGTITAEPVAGAEPVPAQADASTDGQQAA